MYNLKEYHKKYYEDNKEKLNAQSKEYYYLNKEKNIKNRKEYNIKNSGIQAVGLQLIIRKTIDLQAI